MLRSGPNSRAFCIYHPPSTRHSHHCTDFVSPAGTLQITPALLRLYTVLSHILYSSWSGDLTTTLVDTAVDKLSGPPAARICKCSPRILAVEPVLAGKQLTLSGAQTTDIVGPLAPASGASQRKGMGVDTAIFFRRHGGTTSRVAAVVALIAFSRVRYWV